MDADMDKEAAAFLDFGQGYQSLYKQAKGSGDI